MFNKHLLNYLLWTCRGILNVGKEVLNVQHIVKILLYNVGHVLGMKLQQRLY